jgi:chromosome segregation ATPase
MTQFDRRIEFGCDRLSSSVPGSAAAALELVHQAAELFSGIEERARDAEARAQSAAQSLRSAEARIEKAERSRRELIAEADYKLQAASRALRQAELQITAAEDKAAAAEVRAEIAELRAREAFEALALVEEAIRRRILCAGAPDAQKLNAVA